MENKLQYYMRVIKGASFEKFFKVLDNAHERSGKNKVFLFFDILNCMATVQATMIMSYLNFGIWMLSREIPI